MNELSLFNSLFDDGTFGFDFPVLKTRNYGIPKVDVKEDEKAYTLEMDLPGRSEKDVDINLKDKVLTISSVQEAKTEKNAKEDGAWLIHERIATSFSRSFTLPDDVECGGVNATFKNGVLTITMPRNKSATEAKKIAITAA